MRHITIRLESPASVHNKKDSRCEAAVEGALRFQYFQVCAHILDSGT
jgi:hypothetical protein